MKLAPEADLILLSFPLHFTWEFLQAPLFASVEPLSHIEGIRLCLRATGGDVVIALAAFWVAAVLAGSRRWAERPTLGAVLAYLAVGLGLTVAIEHLSTGVLGRWSYGEAMPVLPLLGTGIAPVLQWIAVPLLVLWYLRRLSAGPGG